MKNSILRLGIASVGLVVLPFAGLHAENLGFMSTTDKDPLSYALGETMTFTLTLVDRDNGNSPVVGRRLVWTRDGDDGKKENGLATSDAPLVLKTSIDVPGFVHLTANVLDANGNIINDSKHAFSGSAGADVFNMPEWPEPSDFRQFWQSARRRLDTTPYQTNLFEVCYEDPDVAYYLFSLSTFPGDPDATGIVAWPKNAEPGSLEIVAKAFGYGKPSRTQRPTKEEVLEEGHRQIRVHLCRYGEHPQKSDQSYYDQFWAANSNYCNRNNDGAVEDTDYYKMLMRDLRALQFVKSFKEWDHKTLRIIGGSMGGWQAIACTALDKDVTSCGAGIPWSSDLSGHVKYGRMSGTAPRPPWTPTLDYVDLKNLAKLVKIPMTNLEVGLGDYVCPPSGEVLLFKSFPVCPKKMKFTQNKVHEDGASGVNPPSYYLQLNTMLGENVWFDARINEYINWPEDAKYAYGGAWATDVMPLEDAAFLKGAGTLALSDTGSLTFSAATGKEPGGEIKELVITTMFQGIVVEADEIPTPDPEMKCGVIAVFKDGVPRYYGLAKVGSANAWVELAGPNVAEGRAVSVVMTLKKEGDKTLVTYKMSGTVYSYAGQQEIEVVVPGPVSAVDVMGNCSLWQVSADADPGKRGLFIAVE